MLFQSYRPLLITNTLGVQFNASKLNETDFSFESNLSCKRINPMDVLSYER